MKPLAAAATLLVLAAGAARDGKVWASIHRMEDAMDVIDGKDLHARKRPHAKAAALALALSVAALPAHAESFTADFSSTVLDPNLAVSNAAPGSSYQSGGGVLALNQDAGYGSDTNPNAGGFYAISTGFKAVGDFVARVTTSFYGIVSAGLVFDTTAGDIYFRRTADGRIEGNFFNPSDFREAGSGTNTATLIVSRTGDTITESFDAGDGTGPVVVNSRSGATLASPMSLGLFITEGGTGAHGASFSDFTVDAESLAGLAVPEPASLLLLGAGLVEAGLLRRRGA